MSERGNHTNIETSYKTSSIGNPQADRKKRSRRHKVQAVADNPPDLKEWIAYGLEKYPMAPTIEMKKAFDYYEGQGWTRKETETTRVDLTNWKSALTNWLAGWAKNNPSEVARWRRSRVPAHERSKAQSGLRDALESPVAPIAGMSIMDRLRSMNNAG